MKQNEPGYHEFILKRALAAHQLRVGDRIKVRRTPDKGTITKINDSIDTVNWVKNIPHFIEVKFDDGVIRMCHYSQLKRSKT